MTWKMKSRPNPGSPISAEYECPVHGRFTATMPRDKNGDPPATAPCPETVEIEHHCEDPPCADCGFTMWQCLEMAPWRPSAVRGRVKLGEMDQGKVMDYPPANVCLDTRPLADDPSPAGYEKWKSKQQAITRDESITKRRAKTGRAGKTFIG
jgi:hypothetical protein